MQCQGMMEKLAAPLGKNAGKPNGYGLRVNAAKTIRPGAARK
jgi:hypothetical protein